MIPFPFYTFFSFFILEAFAKFKCVCNNVLIRWQFNITYFEDASNLAIIKRIRFVAEFLLSVSSSKIRIQPQHLDICNFSEQNGNGLFSQISLLVTRKIHLSLFTFLYPHL